MSPTLLTWNKWKFERVVSSSRQTFYFYFCFVCYYHAAIAAGSRANICGAIHITIGRRGDEPSERRCGGSDVEPMRREAHASRDEYHIRVRLVTHNTEQHSTQGRCRQKTSFTMSREEINRARGRERERVTGAKCSFFLFPYLARKERLEVLVVGAGRDVHVRVARLGWAKWSLMKEHWVSSIIKSRSVFVSTLTWSNGRWTRLKPANQNLCARLETRAARMAFSNTELTP